MTKKILYLIAVIWIAITCAWTFSSEYTLQNGREVLLQIAPVDPRDILRGDYVVLDYEISNPPHYRSGDNTGTIYVILNIDKNKVAHAKYTSSSKPKDNTFYIKGKIEGSRIKYGIENYFVKENTGREIEQKMRNGYAKVSIDKNGNAKIKELVYKK